MKRLSTIFAIILLICSCMKETAPEILPENDPVYTQVSLNLSVSDIVYDVESRATAPFIPDVENLLHNVWVVQYSGRGVYLTSEYFEVGGVTEIKDKTINLVWADDCTICLLANAGAEPLGTDISFPDNLLEYKESMFLIDVSLADRESIPMNGFYQGDITGDNTELNVALGRMMTRINIVVNNNTGSQMDQLVLSLTDVSNKCPLFPSIHYIAPDRAILPTLRDPEWGTDETDAPSLAAGESKTYYYYIAPNLYGWQRPTQLHTSCYIDGVKLGGSVMLSDDAPYVDDADRDYRLYPNNNYTFTLNYYNQL